MGTRHYQAVIAKSGDVKVKQYGQWDGYPDGQGKEILTYLRNGDLNKYQNNLSSLKQITDAEIETVNADENWKQTYPYLSRDCGAMIHQMIEDGEVKFVQYCEQEEADKWCEGFYTIDFQKNEFTSEFHGWQKTFPIDNLPTDDEYLKAMEEDEN